MIQKRIRHGRPGDALPAVILEDATVLGSKVPDMIKACVKKLVSSIISW